MKNQGSAKTTTSAFKEIVRSIIPVGDQLIIRIHDEQNHRTMYRMEHLSSNAGFRR